MNRHYHELIVDEALDELCQGRKCVCCEAQLYIDESKSYCQDCRAIVLMGVTSQRNLPGMGRRRPTAPEPSPPNIYRVARRRR